MDTHRYIRSATAGWVFVATCLLGAWELGTPDWRWFAGMVKEGKETSIGLAVLAAVVGVAGPPAFGLLLERIVSSLIALIVPTKYQMWHYDGVAKTPCSLPKSSGSAVFHVQFYTEADEKLVQWAQRRRANFYESLIASLSVWSGVGAILARYHAVGPKILIGALAASAILLVHAGREGRYHREAIEGWIGMHSTVKPVEPDAAPYSRPPSELPTSLQVQSSDSRRTPDSGGCG